jgi:hypothetical protein
VAELPVNPRRSIGALGLGVDNLDLSDQLGVGDGSGGEDTGSALVVGGAGDLEQATGPLDAVTCNLLRLDERVELHRVSLAKKTVARFKISTSSLRERFSRRRRVSSSFSSVIRPGRSPWSI